MPPKTRSHTTTATNTNTNQTTAVTTIEHGASDKNRLVPCPIEVQQSEAVSVSENSPPVSPSSTSSSSDSSTAWSPTPPSKSESKSKSKSKPKHNRQRIRLPPLPLNCPECKEPFSNVIQHLEAHYPLSEKTISDLHLQLCSGCKKYLRQINKHICTKLSRRITRASPIKTRNGVATKTVQPQISILTTPRVLVSTGFAEPSAILTHIQRFNSPIIPPPILRCPSVGDVREMYCQVTNSWIMIDIIDVHEGSNTILVRTCEGQRDINLTTQERIDYRSDRIRCIAPSADEISRQQADETFRIAVTRDPNLSIEDCEKDGNCLFRAVAIYVYDTQESHADVRTLCYDYMEQHRELFSNFVVVNLTTYISRQRHLGQWGDEPEILAIRQALQINIIVYKQTADSSVTEVHHTTSPELPTVRISYHGGIHYNYVHHRPDAISLVTDVPSLSSVTEETIHAVTSSQAPPQPQFQQQQHQQPISSERLPNLLPSALPPSYKHMLHLWRTIPESDERSWELSGIVVLQQAMKAHMNNNFVKRDAALLEFLHLPRTALNKISKDRSKGKKLRKQLSLHQSHARARFSQDTDTEVQRPPHESELSPLSDSENQPHEQYQEDIFSNFETHPFIDSADDIFTRIVKKANRQVREGHVGKAVNSLKANKPATLNEETIKILESLHPASSGTLPQLPHSGVVKSSVSWKDLKEFPDRFFDNGSSPGPSGWTGALMLPLMRHKQSAKALAMFLTLIIKGEIGDGPLRDTLLAARLIPLLKPDTNDKGIRPLAVGEVITRIAANLVLENVKSYLLFPSIQLGVGVSGGPERAIHTIQALLEKQPVQSNDNNETVILISTDIKNAYNSCSRTNI